MSKMDLETEFHEYMIEGLLEDLNLLDIQGVCINCGYHEEIIDNEPWTHLDEKTKLCESCYKKMLKAIDLECPYCINGCTDCLL
jgi:hypothetical protein